MGATKWWREFMPDGMNPSTIGRTGRRMLKEAGDGRDPDTLHRTMTREEISTLLGELRRSRDMKSRLRDRKASGQPNVFTDWDRSFIDAMAAQLERTAGPHPFTGKQLVALMSLCDRLARETSHALEKDNG